MMIIFLLCAQHTHAVNSKCAHTLKGENILFDDDEFKIARLYLSLLLCTCMCVWPTR